MTRGGQPVRLPPVKVEAAFTSLAETIDWGLTAFRIPQQWRDTQGEEIVVAVLDTGVDETHPDLADAILDARDFSRSHSGPQDKQGHGTHVAGTVAARRDDRGVVGVAPRCRLLIAKVLGDDGSGTSDRVAAGVDWACDAGADVLSLSLGSPVPDEPLERAIQRAVEKGKFVVCAAGNAGRPNSVDYPAKWPTTVAVGAVDRNGQASRFSSRGPEVDICAPGQDVLSTYPGGGYAKLSGTSMAAPFVTGVVALLLSKHRSRGGRTPVRTQHQLVEHLRRTATDAGPAGKDPSYGYGLINPDSLLADNIGPPQPPPMPTDGVWVFIPGGHAVEAVGGGR